MTRYNKNTISNPEGTCIPGAARDLSVLPQRPLAPLGVTADVDHKAPVIARGLIPALVRSEGHLLMLSGNCAKAQIGKAQQK